MFVYVPPEVNEKVYPAKGPTVMAFVFKSVPLRVKLFGPDTDPTHVFAKLVMVVAFKTGVVADETVQVIFTSSIPIP